MILRNILLKLEGLLSKKGMVPYRLERKKRLNKLTHFLIR